MEKIKVFLSDPQILFREGIHFVLSGEEDFDVIGEATNNEEALAAIETNAPNVAILNMKSGKLDGPAAARRIKRNLPTVSVILVTETESEEHLFLAMKSSAATCLTKDVDPEYLIKVIKEVNKGDQPLIQTMLLPGIAARILADFGALASLSDLLSNLLARLSPRETDILKSIAEGNGLEQLAAKLSSSPEIVRQHMKLIMHKLVANDQAQAMIEAAQRSLPSIIAASAQTVRPNGDYITKDEFAEFKTSLMERLKNLIGELKQ